MRVLIKRAPVQTLWEILTMILVLIVKAVGNSNDDYNTNRERRQSSTCGVTNDDYNTNSKMRQSPVGNSNDDYHTNCKRRKSIICGSNDRPIVKAMGNSNDDCDA